MAAGVEGAHSAGGGGCGCGCGCGGAGVGVATLWSAGTAGMEQLTVMGGRPGNEMGVVSEGSVGIPGMLGGVGAGIVTPVKTAASGAGTGAAAPAGSAGASEASSAAGGGPNMA